MLSNQWNLLQYIFLKTFIPQNPWDDKTSMLAHAYLL